MLDVMEGGPKLRRWYGSDSSVGDGTGASGDENGDETAAYGDADADEDDDDVELNLPKTSILVTNADGALGESIVVQLILAKASVVAACEAEQIVGAETRFGPYVNVVSNSMSAGARLNGVRAMVVTDALEEDLLAACVRRGVKHVVLVSSAKSAGGGLFPSANEKARRDKTREELAKRSGVALTIIRPCSVKSSPSQGREIRFGQGDTLTGEVSMEDLAEVCARALTRPPKPGESLEFEVSNGAAAAERDWKALFAPLVIV
jgi:nucleoside-diphosphate-sugar epimerase